MLELILLETASIPSTGTQSPNTAGKPLESTTGVVLVLGFAGDPETLQWDPFRAPDQSFGHHQET